MCRCIDVLCVCIHDIYFYLIKKGGALHFTHLLIYMSIKYITKLFHNQ